MLKTKNIQLSEKMQFLMEFGKLESRTLNSEPTHSFIANGSAANRFGNKLWFGQGIRLIDFVNRIIDANGLYPMIQEYIAEPNVFKSKYL